MAVPYDIPVNGIVEVRLNMSQFGQRIMNVCHYRNADLAVANGPTALLAGLTEKFGVPGALTSQYKNWCSTTLRLDYVDAQLIYPIRRAYIRYAINDVCTVLTAPLPQNIQASFTKRSEATGRHAQGRMELPGFSVDDQTAGEWTEPARAAMEQFAIKWKAAFHLATGGAQTAEPIILNRATPNGSFVWTEYAVQQTVRVARRRTVRVGQ